MKGKKIVRLFLFSILIILVIIIVIRIYHYSILMKISETTDKFVNSNEDFFIRQTTIEPNGTTYIKEYYRDGSVSVSKTTTKFIDKEEITSINKSFLDDEFLNSYYANYGEESEDGKKINTLLCVIRNEEQLKQEEFETIGIIPASYTFPNLEFETNNNFLQKLLLKIENTLFYPVVSSENYKGKECYVFKPFNSAYLKFYVDKETLLTVAMESWDAEYQNKYINEYEYLAEIPEGIYEKPNPKDFDEVKFMDWGNSNIDNPLKLIAEKPITGTTLNAGEMLVENIEIKENEKLNFLELTPNESGIINFEIYNLETYNKFKEKFSGLRELTEDDFEAYYVTLAYKVGKKLNYIENYESKESWKFNFVVNSEKTNKENLLLAVIPNESQNRQTVFVESDTNLNIDAETAMNVANNELAKIEEQFDLEFETYIGYTNDHLNILTKEMFANMEYIKTPIAGMEKVCWVLQYRADNEKINYTKIYIDAITGEVIGAKNFYK